MATVTEVRLIDGFTDRVRPSWCLRLPRRRYRVGRDLFADGAVYKWNSEWHDRIEVLAAKASVAVVLEEGLASKSSQNAEPWRRSGSACAT